ncbi:MAG: flagellar hook-associated protein FlgK [Acidobacteriota bacterium]
MGTLVTALHNSTNALRVYGSALAVVQNNIVNANTPGYAKQIPQVFPGAVDGGFLSSPSVTSRSQYMEQAVRNQQQLLGDAQQRAADIGMVEGQFDLSSQFGIPGAINEFFNGFSNLAVNPNNAVARQSVVDLADTVTAAFNQSARGLQDIGTNVLGQTRATVAGINRLAERVAEINHAYRVSASAVSDPALDAQLNTALEELSGLVNFSTVRTADGAVNVYIDGQTILVMGEEQRPINVDFSTPQSIIRDAVGADITGQISSGQLHALVIEKNVLLPGYVADLNTLAASFADTVNTTLAQGVDKNGQPPPADFFIYSATSAAFTLSTNGIAPDQIAAALPGAPGGNANAIALSKLGSDPVLNGFTFTQYFGNLGSRVGRDVASARQQESQYQDTVAQARVQRGDISDVSLDEEATRLLEYQRSYQAISKMIGVLAELTQSVLNILH